MIKIIKGTYGLVVGGVVEAMTKHSAPFSLPERREDELVAAGVAVKVEETAQAKTYADMKMTELRAVAAKLGADVGGAKSRREVIAILETVGRSEETPDSPPVSEE